jgi:hypothetical protein
MDTKTALHTAARRFCEGRFSEWSHTYNELELKEKRELGDLFKPGWDYSEEAYQIFPRYRIDALIQAEGEKLVPDISGNLGVLRSQLIGACGLAEARLLEELTNAIARRAVREEAADFKAYVQVLEGRDLEEIIPLPYRRVLTEEESNNLWNRLRQTWDIGNGYWFPLREGSVPDNLLTLHVDYFESMKGAELLRDALSNRGVSRVFQLNEFRSIDPEYEMEISILEPHYASGGEQYSTSESLDWVVYASHESSITIGGDWLTEVIKERWPDWPRRSYGGPYSTEDMKGTWKTNE